jgi:eukaryotic-like serine/threonine-protein kinase
LETPARFRDLGNYRLVQRIGDGGMGTVYRAVHKRMGRAVAIKLLHRELCADRGIINRFFHEARAANTIRHPNVIEVYDFVDAGSDVYFVMELLQGADLHDTVYKEPRVMTRARIAGIVEQVSAALFATHARNIVHRDLKPENVFLTTRDGRVDFVKIFDFGVAKLDRPDGRSTVEGALLGTPEYMSPEQVRGDKVDGRADIYSLACVAYEMLTRRQAFGGGTQAEILARHVNGLPIPPRAIDPTIPEGAEEAILAALAPDPSARPQTARDFAEQFVRGCGRELDETGFSPPVKPRLGGTLTPLPSLGTGSGPISIRRRWSSPFVKPAVAAAVGVGLAVAIAAGIRADGGAARPGVGDGPGRTMPAATGVLAAPVHAPTGAAAHPALPALPTTSTTMTTRADPRSHRAPAIDRHANGRTTRARGRDQPLDSPARTIDPFARAARR